MKAKFEFRSLPRSLILIALVFSLMSSLAVSFALPSDSTTDNKTSDKAWVEVKCTVPDNFTEDAGLLVMNENTGEMFTLKILAVNDYICRQELPLGKYVIEQAYTSDTFVFEAFPDVTEFTLKKDMPAAAGIKVEIIENDLSQFTENSESKPEAEAVEPSSEQPSEPEGEINSPVESEPTDTEDPAVEETVWFKVLKHLGIAFTAALVFTCLIFGFVYYVRKNSDD